MLTDAIKVAGVGLSHIFCRLCADCQGSTIHSNILLCILYVSDIPA